MSIPNIEQRRALRPWSGVLAAVLCAALSIVFPLWAQAAPSPSAETSQAKAIDDCLNANKVWVFVITEEEEVLSNQCVDSPSTGADALKKAGITAGKNKTGLICTMNDHPAVCPKKFQGQYWAYYHASGAGAAWDYSKKGADQYQPAAGSIEGWCYNKPKTKSCTPPTLAAGSAEGASFELTHNSEGDAPSSSGHGPMSGPVATVVVIAVVAVLLLAAVVVRRRQS
ncbi:hypothetical protein O6R08_08375 [Cutibacterium equinum]|uniref:Tat pathway signal sequence domain protein n=1 Tax=Cutibacterium equinum TaxID=3016342 RepID=A0ABY7QWS8_9ACTN|nr:hypothetical protein [Cutibacterium equinum]WCC79523.1 hypothetical protein O6R08_08375 [Cutibacterium equinum]